MGAAGTGGTAGSAAGGPTGGGAGSTSDIRPSRGSSWGSNWGSNRASHCGFHSVPQPEQRADRPGFMRAAGTSYSAAQLGQAIRMETRYDAARIITGT
jgi:hypothetical protein